MIGVSIEISQMPMLFHAWGCQSSFAPPAALSTNITYVHGISLRRLRSLIVYGMVWLIEITAKLFTSHKWHAWKLEICYFRVLHPAVLEGKLGIFDSLIYFRNSTLKRASRASPRGWSPSYRGTCIDPTHPSHTLDTTPVAPFPGTRTYHSMTN